MCASDFAYQVLTIDHIVSQKVPISEAEAFKDPISIIHAKLT